MKVAEQMTLWLCRLSKPWQRLPSWRERNYRTEVRLTLRGKKARWVQARWTASKATACLARAEETCQSYQSVQSNVGDLQECVVRVSFTLQKWMKDHWVHMCRHFGGLLAVGILEALEDHSRNAGVVAGLYAKSWMKRLKRSRQLFWGSC